MKPVSKTAYYCCGVRMLDAQSKNPICNDEYAHVFMNEEGLNAFEPFRSEVHPNRSNVTRHRIIDDLIRDAIKTDPEVQIVIVGSGFDSRAFRIKGGNWIELDEESIIAVKNEKLPLDTCSNQLTRISIDFETESLEEKLRMYATDKKVIVIVEGVLMYLTEADVKSLLVTLKTVFANLELIADVMSLKFLRKYGASIHAKIAALGTTFRFIAEDPTRIFIQNGFTVRERISTVIRAIELGLEKIPMFLLKYFLTTLAYGYSIYRFEYRKNK